MFDRIVSKLSSIVHTTARAVGTATRKSPWLAPTAILLFFLFV
ncbi:MAG: hypothetical protein ACM31C_13895 [Acidobacteriota bacterium]